MDHGGQQMHDRMMSDHQAGMNKPPKQGHASGTPKPAAPKAPAMSDKPKDDCCMGGMPMPKDKPADKPMGHMRSEEHTSELQSLMRISYAVFCLKKKNTN